MTAPITAQHWRPLDPTGRGLLLPYRKLADQWRARGPLRGWKIGAPQATTRARLGLETALIGFLPTSTECAEGRPIDIADADRPGVEAEIAIHVGRGVRPECSEQELANAVDGLSIAAEIIDLRGPHDDLANVVTTNMFHRAYVLTPANRAIRQIDQNMDGSVLVCHNGREVSRVSSSGGLGEVRWVVAFVAATLARFPEELLPGSVILSGIMTRLPIWVEAGDAVTLEAGPLGRLDLRFKGGKQAPR